LKFVLWHGFNRFKKILYFYITVLYIFKKRDNTLFCSLKLHIFQHSTALDTKNFSEEI